MLEFLKKKWVEWLISITLVILTVILTNHFAIKRDLSSTIQKQIQEKATIEYVDQRDADIQNYVNKQDDNIKELIEQSVDAQTQIITSIDSKLNILINNNK